MSPRSNTAQSESVPGVVPLKSSTTGIRRKNLKRSVAQLEERWTHKPDVGGSCPLGATILFFGDVNTHQKQVNATGFLLNSLTAEKVCRSD